MRISVITPTYNRAYILRRCYESLCAQTDSDFEWIVVDDGSTDNTEALVASFVAENRIDIRYFRQDNGGKQRAHNRGVREADGELTVCVDSDDALSPDAIEKAKQIWAKANERNIGILAKRGDYEKKEPICGDWPDNLAACTMMELQELHGFSGDTVLFFRTTLLKAHYFAEFDGEKFVPEDSLYADLDAYGTMLLSKDVLYYCEYLPDGLTSGYRKLLLKNPMGTSYCYYRRMLRSKTAAARLKNAVISQAFLNKAGRKAEYPRRGYFLTRLMADIFAPLYRAWKKMDQGEEL